MIVQPAKMQIWDTMSLNKGEHSNHLHLLVTMLILPEHQLKQLALQAPTILILHL